MRLHHATLIAGLLCTACGGASVSEIRRPVHSIGQLTDAAVAGLAGKRIFFGHQSVGGNIMEGVADLVRATPGLRLDIRSGNQALPPSGGFFAHASVGENWRPTIKTDDFADRIRSGFGAPLDIAFHKYCYVDITAETDVDAIFGHYRDTMARLRQAYPKIVFVHVTVPIAEVQAGLKAEVKRLIRRAPFAYEDNVRREQFNERMRREYADREPVFDLAAIESTDPEGRTFETTFRGVTVRTLFAPYTPDGGHLNEVGRQRVAEELLVMLAGLSSPK
jgi:hypothetical protein